MRKIALLFLFSYGLGAYAAQSPQSPSDDARGCSNSSELRDINIILTRIDQDLDCILLQLEDLDCGTAIEEIIEETAEIASKILVLAESPGCCDQVRELLSLVELIDSKIEFIPVSSCCEQISDALSHIITIETKLSNLNGGDCCSLIEAIISRIPSIESRVAGLDLPALACTKTRITGPTTIFQPGYYCLANNIEGIAGLPSVIEIGGNDIILDLNGYTITVNGAQDDPLYGIQLFPLSASNVIIRNGIIITTGIFTANTSAAINVDQNTNVRIEDILIQDNYNLVNGIALNIASNVVVDSVHVSGCLVSGMELFSSVSCLIRNCTFNNNGNHGLHILGSANNTVQNCTANFNIFSEITDPSFIDMVGFLIENLQVEALQPSDNNMFISCNAGGHVESITDSAAGFRIGNIGNPTDGPSNAGTANVLLSCVAQGNNIGIDIIESNGTQLVKDSVALNNDTAGFRHSPNLASSSISLIEYLNNAALANPINYDDPADPAYNGPIVPYESLTPNLDLYWGNVQLQ